ncbi:MAG TPA: glycerol kinase GlpK [Clostridiales bacterium]|nr:glycerol kinase GlpK [Clostridiales bacterium]
MKKYIMSLDQGTTSSRCIIFDQMGNTVAKAQKEFTQYFPKSGWVEQDAREIWSTQFGVAAEALQQKDLTAENIAAIGITNQRETTVVWDKATGEPVNPAIVWQCRRTAEDCAALIDEGYGEMIREKTGLCIDAYFSATKIKWILDHVPGTRKKAERGELLFGTVDTWLLWKLTEGRVHATDYSNASRTLLFNIETLQWDQDILNLLEIPRSMLPEARPSSEIFGETTLFGGSIPIGGIAGDQQAALFGQGCFTKGSAKNTYGTGCFMLLNTGTTPVTSKNGLLTTIAWGYNNQVYYALEGSVFIAGAAIQWLRDQLKIIETAGESEGCADSVENTNGVYFVPAFVGLGAPYWNPEARGIITGLSRGTNRNHIIRAALESLAFQSYDVLKAMTNDAETELSALKVDGGACANNFLMQFQADITETAVYRPKCIETTALGAAYLAGLSVGYWKGTAEIAKLQQIERVFTPKMAKDRRDQLLAGWEDAVRKLL